MLPFDAESLFALHTRFWQETWPITAPILLAHLLALWLALRGSRDGRVPIALLALGWIWLAGAWLFRYLATLDFSAPLYALLFALQGVLLIVHGPIRGRLAMSFEPGAAQVTGLAILAFAAIGYPLLDLGFDADAFGVRLVGAAATPTALFCLGLLLSASPRIPMHLFVLPVLWSLIAGFRGWVLDLPADLLAPGIAAVALTAALRHNRRQSANSTQVAT